MTSRIKPIKQSMPYYSNQDKARHLRQMFGHIAHRYVLMNRLMSVGQDRRWRRKMIRLAELPQGGRLLDIATGTGDVAAEARRMRPDLAKIVAADFSLEMMRQGRTDPERGSLFWLAADALRLPFPDENFEAVMSAFLMRNVVDIRQALREQWRVTRRGGRVLVLDITRPPDHLWGRVFRFYFHHIVPLMGAIISGQADAYTYLPNSAEAFLRSEELKAEMLAAGLEGVCYYHMMLGTVALHLGNKG